MIDPLPEPERPQNATWHQCPLVKKAHQDALRRVLEDLSHDEEYPGHQGDFGVITLGGGRYWLGCVISAHFLRRAGYNGPIEIWHGHYSDPEPVNPEMVRKLDVRIVNALKVAETTKPRILRGWEAKTHAVKNCSYRKVLFLDSDAYCLVNPLTVLDELLDYDKGTVAFWEDFPGMAKNLRWEGYGQPKREVPPIQGGQFVIDRQRAWPFLLTIDWVNQHSDYFYRWGFGDQDGFRAVLSLDPGVSYVNVGKVIWNHPAFLCRGRWGFPNEQKNLIVHRVAHKLTFGSELVSSGFKWSAPNPHLPNERYLFNLLAFLDDSPLSTVFQQLYQTQSVSEDELTSPSVEWYIKVLTGLWTLAPPQTVIDLGCGSGNLTQTLARRFPGVQFLGIDCATEPKSDLPNCRFQKVDVLQWGDNWPKADWLIARKVVQHWSNRTILRFWGDLSRYRPVRYVLFCDNGKDYKDHRLENIPDGSFRSIIPDQNGDFVARLRSWHVLRNPGCDDVIYWSKVSDET